MTKFLLPVLCCFGLLAEEVPNRQLSLQELLSGMAAMDKSRTESLTGYSSVRHYTLINPRFKITAEMQVRVTYQHPGTKSFKIISETGSSMIRKNVLRRLIKTEMEAATPDIREGTRITPANYKFLLIGTEMEQGRRCYLLDAQPIHPTKFNFRGRILVDPQDFAIVRIEGAPAQNPSFWIQKTTFVHNFQKFGPYWLPVSNSSESAVRVAGRTEVKIDYSDYKIDDPATTVSGAAGAGALSR